MSDNHPTVGRLIRGPAQRDAIHTAIAPVMASEKLEPGDRIKLVSEGSDTVEKDNSYAFRQGIGIVDPFLEEPVEQGQRFWMFLLPNTITSLAHHWTHPAFEPVVDPNLKPRVPLEYVISREWIEDYARNDHDISFEEITEAADAYIRNGDYLSQGGKFEGHYISDEFWDHYEVVTGRTAAERGSFFSCSC